MFGTAATDCPSASATIAWQISLTSRGVRTPPDAPNDANAWIRDESSPRALRTRNDSWFLDAGGLLDVTPG